jgi:hypothetical protein
MHHIADRVSMLVDNDDYYDDQRILYKMVCTEKNAT